MAEMRSLSISQRFFECTKSSSDHALPTWPRSDVLHFDSNEVFDEFDVCSCLLWQIVEGFGSCDWLLPALKLLVFYLYVG